jgi:hypothetical protein
VRGRPGRVRRLSIGLAAGAQVIAGCVVAGVVTPGTAVAATPDPPTVRAPLATALTTSTGSWAVVAMGERGVPLNTFWELFFRATGAASWKLVTPKGVADNGGLTMSVSTDGAATVGFEPSQLLRYSPLALSSDDGVHWTPALVPTSLVAGPDALAVAGGTGPALSLVRRGAGEVLTSSGALLNWKPLPDSSSLGSGTAPACAIDGLDAVALGPSADQLVGTGCRRPGQVGLFERVGSHWQLIGPSLHGSLAGATTRVMRLDSTGATTTALVAERGHGPTGLLALWRNPAGMWSTSGPLPFGSGQRLVSSAVGEQGQQMVLLNQSGTNGVLYEASGPGQPWSTLPSPPAGTVTLATQGDGSTDAFSVSGSHLRIFTLDAGQTTWSVSQTMNVPISYGSS